jgi:Ca-activated chloride channel family protein
VNGEPQTFTYADNLFRTQGGDDFIPRLWATRAIGHLLREVRLHGDNPELVQSIVNLSIRYGIITPYTSYLIEEDDIFTQAGRTDIAEEAMVVEVTRVVSEAVEAAAAAAGMAAAEAPMALPTALPTMTAGTFAGEKTAVSDQVVIVGSKTFVWENGRYTDTTFDPEKQAPLPIAFASDAYFDLIAANPELGPYFALGPKGLVVAGGQAYETVETGGVETLVMPQSAEVFGSDEGDGGETAVPPETAPLPTREPSPTGPKSEPGLGSSLCGAAMLMPLFVMAGIVGLRRKGWGWGNG